MSAPTFKRTDELTSGDHVIVARSIVRTVERVATSDYVSNSDEPVLYVMYQEGRTDDWSAGNSACPSSLWLVADESDDEQTEAITAYLAAFGIAADDYDHDEFLDSYSGVWESERDFAEQLADDLGLISPELSWPHSCIDWDQATRELFYDYVSVRGTSGALHVFRNV